MPTLREIRRRIRTIQSTAKITHAMELVAASKMRRAQQRALAARPYAERLRWMLADLSENLPLIQPENVPPLLQRREVRNIGAILITPDRGLCGGLNANMNRFAAAFVLEQSAPVQLVCVGRKGRDFFRRVRGVTITAEFTNLGDYPSYEDILPIARVVIDDYIAGNVDQVVVLYPVFVNTAVQRPTALPLLPIEPPADTTTFAVDYIYEPGREFVLEQVLPRYVEMQIYDAVLELAASEQSARMVAMRNATDNANQLTEDLTLVYNKARQDQITKELLDIVGGVAALTQS